MPLDVNTELFEMSPVYTKTGQHYGYILKRAELDRTALITRENVDQIKAAIQLIEANEQQEEAFFHEARNEALDPNR